MKRLLVLVLLLAVVSAQITEPKLVSRLDSTISQGGSIGVNDGSIFSMELNLTTPQDTDYQSSSLNAESVFDEEDNALISLSSVSPPNPYSYSFESVVTTTERVTTYLPESYSVPSDFIKYVRPSETVQSDHQVVKELAEWITANATNDFERVALLTAWVHNFIDYDLELVGQRKDSLWILENKQGVCVEYSNLFAALARSLGYPTRFVLGQAYGDYGWLGHAWNEVYIGDWIPVDATWLEAGHLDAVHIEFYKSAESEANNRVIAKVSNDASITWDKPEFAGESGGTSVDITDIELTPELENYVLTPVASSLGYGEQTLITFTMRGEDYRMIDLNLVSCRSDKEILNVQNPGKIVVFEPGKNSVVSWVATAGKDLDPNIIYTCPLTLNSRYLMESNIAIDVSKISRSKGFTAFLSDDTINLGETISLFVKTAQQEKITVVSGDYIESRISTTGNTKFSFTPTQAGTHEILLASENGGVKTLSFSVDKVHKVFYITDVIMPDNWYVGEEENIQLHLENELEASEQVNLEINIDNVDHLSRIPIEGIDAVNFSYIPNMGGEKIATIKFSFNGISDEKTASFFVYDSPKVTLGDPVFEPAFDEMVLLSLPVEGSNSVDSIYLAMSGQKQQVTDGTANFLVEQSLHKIILEYTDLRGNNYTESVIVNTVRPPIEIDFWETYAFFLATMVAVTLFLMIWAFSKIIKKVRN